MKTAKFGFILLVVALLLVAVSCILLHAKQTGMAARLMIGSFASMAVSFGLITFDKRWAKERHEMDEGEKNN